MCRIAWNHPLPDGNKRAAWACLLMFLDLNGAHWVPDPPNVDEAEHAVLKVAAGSVDEAWMAAWLRERVEFWLTRTEAPAARLQSGCIPLVLSLVSA